MDDFFAEPLEFFKNGNYSKLFVKCVSSGNTPLKCLSTLFVRFFQLKVRKILNLQSIETMMKKQSILKNAFIF